MHSVRRAHAVSACLLLGTFAAAGTVLSGCESAVAPTTAPVTVGGKTYQCRLALDDASREKGLSGVSSLAAGEGMLFVFTDSAPRNFWMVDCLMDIDIAFIDPFGFVTAVHTMPKEPLRAEGEDLTAYQARLARYPSVAPAQYALEVAPGELAKLGVRRGVRVEFDRDSLKKHAK